MGICTVEEEKNRPKFRRIIKPEESKNNDLNSPKLRNKKSINNKAVEIVLNTKKTIIKLIGEIKGKSININNNFDCLILIMENSQSIKVENCKNCSILLAPCASTITIDNCENLNLISASLNLIIRNTKKGNLYIFSNNSPVIKDSEDILLGNFFFQYTELPEMFINSNLNIWNNKWSCYEEEGKNKNIKYSNDIVKQKIIKLFEPTLNKCYINVNQYQFLPFTYGKSLFNVNNDDSYVNFIIIIRKEDFQENEILKLLFPEELENYNIKLISTLALGENNDKIKDFIQKLELNKDTTSLVNYILRKNLKAGLFESHISSALKTSINKSRLNELDLSNNEYITSNYFKSLKNGDLLFLWFVNCSNDFKEIIFYFNNFFEPININIIKKETFGWDEKEFKNYLEHFFEFKRNV